MKVVGIGLPKTGTTTLKKALEILGVEHEVGDHVHLYNETPKADIYILTVRESVDTWFDSVKRWDKIVGNRPEIRVQRLRMYGSDTPNESWKSKYEKHARKWMKSKDKTVELMCWDCGQGWEDLCAVLGLPIPKVPFPHANKNTRYAKGA